MLYYAKLNESQICTEIITRTSKIDLSGYIQIPDYNQTYLWRKWLGDQWSAETYEPTVTNEWLQEQIAFLQTENTNLNIALTTLAAQKDAEITDLQLALAELAESMEV